MLVVHRYNVTHPGNKQWSVRLKCETSRRRQIWHSFHGLERTNLQAYPHQVGFLFYAFFSLLEPLHQVWHVFCILCSVNGFANGLFSLFSLEKLKLLFCHNLDPHLFDLSSLGTHTILPKCQKYLLICLELADVHLGWSCLAM